MKFTVHGKALLTLLQAVGKVLNSKNTIAILDNFLFRLEGERLYATGSDSENVITAWIDVVESEGEGSICMPAKRLLEVMKEISNQPVTFEVGDNLVVDISYLNGSFKFMGVDASIYPAPHRQDDDAARLEIPAEIVRKGITYTIFGCATDPLKGIYCGIWWDLFEDHIVFVSSDTQKLVRYQNDTYAPGVTMKFALHSKTASVLNSLLNADTGNVEVDYDGKSAIFTFDNFTFSCRFLKGKFPNYDRVIVKDNPYEIVVDRQALLLGVRRVSLFSSDSRLVRYAFSTDIVSLTSQDLDYSLSAAEKVPCQYSGTPITIGLDSNDMMILLSNIPSEEVRLQLSDPARPVLLLPEEKREGESLKMILLPLVVR